MQKHIWPYSTNIECENIKYIIVCFVFFNCSIYKYFSISFFILDIFLLQISSLLIFILYIDICMTYDLKEYNIYKCLLYI